MKKILCTFLAVVTLVGAIPVSATDVTPDNGAASVVEVEPTPEDFLMPLDDAYDYQNVSIYNGGSASNSFKFTLDSSHPHGKVWVNNTSSSSINISFCYNKKSAVPYATFQLAAGSSQIYWINAHSQTGTHYCNITTSDGSSLNGTISIRKATTKSEME